MQHLPDPKDWTLDTVRRLVTEFAHEPGHFDFKPVMRGTGPNADELTNSVRRTACSMANTLGGFIVFGVADGRVPVTKPEDRIVGFPVQADLRKEFGDIVSRIEPKIHFDAIPKPLLLPTDAAKGIYVVEVPRSEMRPHMFDERFYGRGDGGSAAAMNVYEVREQMVFREERMRKVTLLRLDCLQILLMAEGFLGTDQHKLAYNFQRVDASSLRVLVADVCGMLPPGSVLKDFLRIAELSQMINETLNRLHTATMDAHGSIHREATNWPAMVLSEATELRDLCRRCGEELEKKFGKLD